MKKTAGLFLASLLLVIPAAFAQVADQANQNYKTPAGRESIARSLGDPTREERQKPRDIVDAMDLKPGGSVADVGTGVGFMLPYLSHAVGDSGHVYGEDIQNDFLDKAKVKAQLSRLNNVQFVVGTDRDPKLPADTLEAALVLDVYHHFDYPDKMLAAIRGALKPGAHLVIVDYYKSASPTPGHIRLERDEVAAEIERNGFKLLSKRDHIPKTQYMLTLEKTR